MLQAISMGDLSEKALRVLTGYRCLRAAGLGQFDSVGQTATVTVGAKQTGDIATITINGTDYSHEVIAGNADNAAVAAALVALIEGIDPDVSASAALAVITLVAIVPATAFTLTTGVAGVGATTTLTTVGTVQATKQVETDNAIEYLIDGKLYTKAATTAIVVTGGVLPISSFRWYIVQADTSGNLTTVAGEDNAAWLPAPADAKTIIGAFKIVTDATHTFTPALTPVNAAGITATFFDLSAVPKAGYPA